MQLIYETNLPKLSHVVFIFIEKITVILSLAFVFLLLKWCQKLKCYLVETKVPRRLSSKVDIKAADNPVT